MDTRDDAELMAQVRAGDREAFGVLVERHKDPLVNYLTRVTGHRDRGEELAQEAFIRLFRSASGYREQGRLLPLLYRIATNLVRTEERRARRWRILGALIPAVAPFAPTQEAALLRDETQREVAAALARVPMTYRIPMVLRDVEDWGYEEIAAALGCPEGTVKSRIARGREALRRELADYWERGRTAAAALAGDRHGGAA